MAAKRISTQETKETFSINPRLDIPVNLEGEVTFAGRGMRFVVM